MEEEAKNTTTGDKVEMVKKESEEKSEVKNEPGQIEGQSKWYVGKYMGLNRQKSKSLSSSNTGTDRESSLNERPSEDRESVNSGGRLSSSASTQQRTGWYPGKYVGLRDRRKSSVSSENSDNLDKMDTGEEPAKGQTTWTTFDGDVEEKPRSRTISSWLSSFSKQDASALHDEGSPHDGDDDNTTRRSSGTGYYSKWFHRSHSGVSPSSSAKDLNGLEDTEAEKEESKKEAMITRTVRAIRNKFIDRKLQGRILIYRTSGVVTTAVLCEVNATDTKSAEVTAEEIADLSYNDRRAITMTDTVLNSLERRSRAWDGCDFAKEVLLTRGVFIGVSDPFVGMIGFSIQIDFSCTIQSLLASRRRFEAKVKAEKELALLNNPQSRESFFSRSFSFSHSSTPADVPAPTANAFVNQPIVPVVKVETSDDFRHKVHLSDDEADDDGVKEI